MFAFVQSVAVDESAAAHGPLTPKQLAMSVARNIANELPRFTYLDISARRPSGALVAKQLTWKKCEHNLQKLPAHIIFRLFISHFLIEPGAAVHLRRPGSYSLARRF